MFVCVFSRLFVINHLFSSLFYWSIGRTHLSTWLLHDSVAHIGNQGFSFIFKSGIHATLWGQGPYFWECQGNQPDLTPPDLFSLSLLRRGSTFGPSATDAGHCPKSAMVSQIVFSLLKAIWNISPDTWHPPLETTPNTPLQRERPALDSQPKSSIGHNIGR